MREIKFRAWAIASGKMFFPNSDEGWDLDNGSLRPLPNTILMQFTGLKDCKRTKEYPEGQEIYHHDIVKDKNGYKWEIMWANAQFYLLSIEKDLLPDKYKFPGYCEVIGNIYENPKLLEAKE